MKNILIFIVTVCLCSSASATIKGYIKAGHLKVYYEVTGSGKPLLLLHAGLQDMRMWDEQIKAFSHRYKVITIDLPEHGKTIGIDTITPVADVIKTILDNLHIQTTSVIGLSLGSVCATDFVIAYPERVEKLLLISPGLYGFRKFLLMDTLSQKISDRNDMKYSTDNADTIATYFTATWCDGPYRKPAEVNAVVHAYIYNTTRQHFLQHGLKNFPKFNEPSAAEKINSIQKPVLIIDGDIDVPLVISIAGVLQKQISGAERITIKNVAHMLNMEEPALFNKAVLKFLEK